MSLKKFEWEIWIEKREVCEKAFYNFLEMGLIKQESEIENLKNSHLKKADYNLDFINFLFENKKFYDWGIVGSYYAIYRASLALLASKGYSSKKHLSTLCAIIWIYFHNSTEKLIDEKDVELIVRSSIEKEEVGYFVEAKDKRETASYGISEEFTKQQSEDLKDKTILFLNKVRQILE